MIRSLRKTSISTLDPGHLKVKDVEWDISLVKSYCITISMQKISSIHQFNLKLQHILNSSERKSHTYPKIIEATFIFPEFVALFKKSVCSKFSLLRYIQF